MITTRVDAKLLSASIGGFLRVLRAEGRAEAATSPERGHDVHNHYDD
jgi:hypothetical protein